MTKFYDVLDKIKTKLLAEPFCNTVSYGSLDDIDLNKQSIFPLSHIIVNNCNIDTNTLTFNVSGISMDIVEECTKEYTENLDVNEHKKDVIKIKHNDKDITLPTKKFIGEVMRFDKNLFNTLKKRKLLVQGFFGPEINTQKVLKYKDIENFHKTFKKDKVVQNKKSIDYLRELKMDFDYSGNYQSPTGQQFKNAFKNDPVLYKIENVEKAKLFQDNLRTDVERFSKSNNDKKFLEKLIDITKEPMLKFQDTTTGRKRYLLGLDN